MNHVIEVESFYQKLREFISGKGYGEVNVWILHNFECLGILLNCDIAGKPREVIADILPRVEASGLKFLASVNVADESEEAGRALARHLVEFFTRECAGGGVNEFIGRFAPDRLSLLFFCQEQTLLLRLKGEAAA